jgi:hypothetical protein
MPVSLTVWQQLCGCPGGEERRAWKEDPDESWPGAREQGEQRKREWQERQDAEKEAWEAARAAAGGRTHDEVRDLYVAELEARGQDVPPGPLLEAMVDMLTGHRVRGILQIGKAIGEFMKHAFPADP